MKKNTQILLGVGALAVVGYFIWKSTQKDGTKASMQGKRMGMQGKRMAIGKIVPRKHTKQEEKKAMKDNPYYTPSN
jgi:hypothetical protein